MGEKMTLEEVRDWLREAAKSDASETNRRWYALMADSVTPHLTQPAQAFGPVTNEATNTTNASAEPIVASENAQSSAVDVGAIREVIHDLKTMETVAESKSESYWLLALADNLTRAIGNALAEGWRVTVDPVAMPDCDDACQVRLHCNHQHFQVGHAHETREEGDWYARQLRLALGIHSPIPPQPEE